MPRDDLSIDFVKKMPPLAEALDPALILDEWINRTQNLPEEIRFLQDELAEKDRQSDKLLREIDDRDGRIQKWIKAHGSHQHHPKEAEYRATIEKNYAQAEQLVQEKIALAARLQLILDKHLRQLDVQIKGLYDRHEPGFEDPDELPSLVRPSAANQSQSPTVARSAANPSSPITSALNSLVNNASQPAVRISLSHPHARTAHQGTAGVASAPVTPAASIVIVNNNRAAREGSSGPVSAGAGPSAAAAVAAAGPAPKRGPRSNSILGGLPTPSSGLARHSSLGPGTPKGATGTGVQRAGSAGPRTGPKSAIGAGPGRRATPSGGIGRKKSAPSAINTGAAAASTLKSGLSRVKRPPTKDSASSAADSELSDAESNSGGESDARTGGRGTPNAPASRSGLASQASHGPTGPGTTKEGGREQVGGPSTGGEEVGGNITGGNPSAGGSGGGSGSGNGNGSGNLKREPGAGNTTLGGTSRGGHVHIRRGRGRGLSNISHNDDAMDIEEDDAGDDRKYCICQNVSHGDMVACDNDDCPFEWFHWSCVGLKSEPNGTWYCPVCTKKMGRAANL